MSTTAKGCSKHVNTIEDFYEADNKTWVGKPLKLRTFIENWNELFTENPYYNSSEKLQPKQILKEILKVNDTQFKEIEKDCDPIKLDIPEEKFYDFTQDIFPNNITFETLTIQKEDIELRNQNSGYATKTIKFLKDTNYPQPIISKDNGTNVNSFKFIPDDILILVQICQPSVAAKHSHYKFQRSSHPLKIEQEFWIHGSQHLTDLKEAISCVSDLSLIGDFSENPTLENGIYACDVYKSSLFYINNTFYIDKRLQENIDYTIEIKQWLAEQKMEIPQTLKMEETEIKDLEFRPGFTYLYMHQGHCEHFIVFADVRLVNPRDPLPGGDTYPVYVPQPPKRRSLCCACQLYSAKWLVTGHKLLPEFKNFFCDLCYKAFHFDRNNKKIGEFTAQPFLDHSTVI